MDKKILLLIVILTALNATVSAQSQNKSGDDKKYSSENKKNLGENEKYQPAYFAYLDSLEVLKVQYENWHYTGHDTLQNPYYFRLFTVPTFYTDPIRKKMSILYVRDKEQNQAARSYPDSKIELQDYIDHSFSHLYTTSPVLVSETEHNIKSTDGLRKEVFAVKQDVKLTTKEKEPEKVDIGIHDNVLDINVYKPNFWKISGNYSLDFMQSYVSDNWYQGGESNNSLMASVTVRANYDNKQKVLFENTLEMRLGFKSSKSDKIHKYKTYSDLLRLTDKIGLRAAKSWYYTLSLQSWTQFYPSYRSNDTKVYSDFMSPFEMTPSLGMEYKKSMKNFNITANISPFAGRLKYVDRKALETSFGLKPNHHSRFTYGSNMTVNYSWTIMKSVSCSGRIYYFTDYDLAQLDWEHTFNLTVNKYLSTRLFLHPRFDDSARRKPGKSYLQFTEYLSLGLKMSF